MDRRFLLAIAALVVVLVGFALIRLVTGDDVNTEAVVATTTVTESEATATADATTTSTPAETPTTGPIADDFPVTIAAPNGPVTIPTRPERIVSISPTSTEVLFAIGAGDRVVAVDDQSDFPAGTPTTDLTGISPNIEAIASYDPDLVFVSFDPGDVIAGLEALGIPVIMHPTASSLDDAYVQWEQTGAATGNAALATDLVSTSTESINASVGLLPENTDALTYYYELDPTYYSATSSTFVGNLFTLTGMANIADSADPDGFGFPQLTSEYIVDQNPTLIYLADTKCCGQDKNTVRQRPGWDTLSAVDSDSVIELDDDIASRWGPRITLLIDDIVASILGLEGA